MTTTMKTYEVNITTYTHFTDDESYEEERDVLGRTENIDYDVYSELLQHPRVSLLITGDTDVMELSDGGWEPYMEATVTLTGEDEHEVMLFLNDFIQDKGYFMNVDGVLPFCVKEIKG